VNHQSGHIELASMAALHGRRRYPVSSSVISALAVGIDSLTIVGAGLALYLWVIPLSPGTWDLYAAATCFAWVASLMLFQLGGLYQFEAIVRPRAHVDRLATAIGTAFLFLLAAAFAFKVAGSLSGAWMGGFAAAAFAGILVVRVALSRLALRLARDGVFKRNVIIVGTREHAARLLERIGELRPDFVSVIGVFVDRPGPSHVCGVPVLGRGAEVVDFVRRARVDDVLLSLPWSAERQITATIEQLRELPVNVYLGSDLAGLSLDFREPPAHFSRMPVFAVIGRPLSGWGVALKAIEDYTLATLCLAATLPILAVAALAIKLDSPGPVLFKQKRLGFNNRVFVIYKLRSMHHVPEPAGRTIQATKSDSRVTRVGGFLRRSSIDELPQLLNVLNGTMSLVGPRPHAVDHNEEYARKIRGYFARHRVKPGITGWAQVNGLRGQTESPDQMAARVRLDVYYTENWSLLFDLYIMARTIVVVVTGRNAH
jgi:Undecaprenyl-phosphate glucose phosphotransferase